MRRQLFRVNSNSEIDVSELIVVESVKREADACNLIEIRMTVFDCEDASVAAEIVDFVCQFSDSV